MTNPKEVLNDFEEKFYTRMNEDYFLDNGYYSAPDMKLGDKIKQFIISSQITTLTSQLEAIPEDEKVKGLVVEQDMKRWGINQERQRQRQSLQLAINKWSELK